MKTIDEYILTVMSRTLLNRVHGFANVILINWGQRNMTVKGLIEGNYLLDLRVTYCMVRCTVPLILRIPDTFLHRS